MATKQAGRLHGLRHNAGMSVETIPLPGAELRLYAAFLPAESADATMATLMHEVAWTQRPIRIYGREVVQPRLLCWIGDPEARYRYSGGDYEPEPWTPTLSVLRERIESVSGARFNSVLCNRYRDGNDAMGWHSDDEPELGTQPVIASLSLGVTRPMKFRPRKGFEEGRAGELPLVHGTCC